MQELREIRDSGKRPSVWKMREAANAILSAGAIASTQEEQEAWFSMVEEWVGLEGDKLTALRQLKKASVSRARDFSEQVDELKVAIVKEGELQELMDSKAIELLEKHYEITGRRTAQTSDGGKAGLRIYKGERVVVDEETTLPEEFVRVQTSPDKQALLFALKNGRKISGVSIEHSERIGVQWGKIK
jgi:hypothetical protein